MGAGWCHLCREQRQAVSWRWPPWGAPPGRALLPSCPWDGHWCIQHTGPGAGGQGVPALEPGPGMGQGQLSRRVLPQLGDHQFLLEEEKAPLAPLAAPGQLHVCAQHRLCIGESVPAEQSTAGIRKAAAAGPGRAPLSPSHGGSPPGATAAVGLAHPARDRRTLAVHQGCGPAGDSEDGKRVAGAWSALLGQTLPPPSAALCQHSSVLPALGAVGSN